MTISARPANPASISFDRRCFVQDGERVEFVCANPTGATYPKVFSDRGEAESFARRTNRVVTERRAPVMRRIAWTLAEVVK